ncbi:hypothetical protein PACTADRAFT_47924 [Pachysolen tannophilus NRRL Y-2460]|uniref:Uncharacterized protein n=1 Tax=Pachysolen tannophilus NRRL Y-2460 TaxID=669874 RepID=A0A1E4U264_PACTA|nr:hypothetical protein PACTADRAFT_47924 [Pachysolen tannophilus NRRL Y-2460]
MRGKGGLGLGFDDRKELKGKERGVGVLFGYDMGVVCIIVYSLGMIIVLIKLCFQYSDTSPVIPNTVYNSIYYIINSYYRRKNSLRKQMKKLPPILGVNCIRSNT